MSAWWGKRPRVLTHWTASPPGVEMRAVPRDEMDDEAMAHRVPLSSACGTATLRPRPCPGAATAPKSGCAT